MAFGRRKRDQDQAPAAVAEELEVDESIASAADADPEPEAWTGDDFADAGPFDIEDFDDPDQAETGRLDLGSVLVPMAAVLNGDADLPRDRTLVLHCHSGVRSLQCANALQDAGYTDVLHVAGGIAAWLDTRGRLTP